MEPSGGSLFTTLYPLLRSMQFAGLCPVEFSNQSVQSYPLGSWKALRIILNLVCMFAYFTSTLVGSIGYFQSLDHEITIRDLVGIAYDVYSTLIPIGIVGLFIRQRSQFAGFFADMAKYKEILRTFIDCKKTGRDLRRILAFYWVTCLMALAVVGFKAWRGAAGVRVGLLHFQVQESGTLCVILSVAIQVYAQLLNSLSSGFIEVLCTTLAFGFVDIIQRIQKRVVEEMQPKDVDTKGEAVFTLFPHDPEAKKNSPGLLAFVNAVQPRDNDFTWNDPMKTYEGPDPFGDTTNRLYSPDPESNSRPILQSLKKIQVVNSMQGLINDVFGHIIALNSALMMFISCVLLYTYIKTSIVVLTAPTGSETWIWIDRMDYWGNAVLMTFTYCRLLFVFYVLGNVHNASVRFNATISKSLLSLNNAKDSELNIILAAVTMYSINPIAYSAGGYFVFSRSSLMAAASIITTYLIFLLQA